MAGRSQTTFIQSILPRISNKISSGSQLSLIALFDDIDDLQEHLNAALYLILRDFTSTGLYVVSEKNDFLLSLYGVQDYSKSLADNFSPEEIDELKSSYPVVFGEFPMLCDRESRIGALIDVISESMAQQIHEWAQQSG